MDNQLINGDSFDILPTFPDNYFDAIITDPPYQYLNHKLDAPFDEEKLTDIFFKIVGNGYLVFFGRGSSFYKMNYLLSIKNLKFVEEIVWDKVRVSTITNPIARKHETIAIYRKGKATLNKIYIDSIEQYGLSNSWVALFRTVKRFMSSLNKIGTIEELKQFKEGMYNITTRMQKHGITTSCTKRRDRGYDSFLHITKGHKFPSIFRCVNDHYNYQHPTQKPLELMKRLVELTTPENGIVLDPFGGSGTTALACLETGRRYVVIEREKEYYDIAKRRIDEWHQQNTQLSIL